MERTRNVISRNHVVYCAVVYRFHRSLVYVGFSPMERTRNVISRNHVGVLCDFH